MKKLFLTEFDGSDKIADYGDGKECGSSDPFDI